MTMPQTSEDIPLCHTTPTTNNMPAGTIAVCLYTATQLPVDDGDVHADVMVDDDRNTLWSSSVRKLPADWEQVCRCDTQ